MDSIKKIWSIYRITWVLYLGILLLPISVYLVYHQMGSVVQGEKIVRDVARTGGDILAYISVKDPIQRNRIASRIDQSFSQNRKWFAAHNSAHLYVGTSTPLKDFRKLYNCWIRTKAEPSTKNALKCWDHSRLLLFAVERFNTLNYHRIQNYMILAISLSIALLLLLIYVVRYYMYHQVCKSIVHVPEEGLHDKEYCRLSLTQLCAQSERGNRPLSVMLIRLKHKEERSLYKIEEAAEALVRVESAMREQTRLSDIACRISNDNFLLLMPNTDNEGAQLALQRLQRILAEKIGEKLLNHVELMITISTREEEENCHDFWKRSTKGA